MAGPTKPTGMVRTIICPDKTFFSFYCERKLVICYSAITYELLVPESKLFSLGISGVFELCANSGSESEQFRWVSIGSDVRTCEASGSDSDTESSEQLELLKRRFSEHAVSLQFVVVCELVSLVCPSELSRSKKNVTSVVFVFFSGTNSLTILLAA